MRTRTVCGVSRGDPPLVIRWLKDDTPLAAWALGTALGDGLGDHGAGGVSAPSVSQLDQYTSLLSIPHLSAPHSGRFTCVATNAAAEVRYTATLSVKGRSRSTAARPRQ